MLGGKHTARNLHKLQGAVALGALGIISWILHVKLGSLRLTTGDADGVPCEQIEA